jgi:hypothetical protein
VPEFDPGPVTEPASTCPPAWMRSVKEWATRKGTTADAKRACIEVVVPRGERPWDSG